MTTKDRVKVQEQGRAAQLMALSETITELCDCLAHVFHDLQEGDPTKVACRIFVQPIVLLESGYTPLGWVVQIWENVEGEDKWVLYVLTRDFRTSHVKYAENTGDITLAKEQGISKTINFMRWLIEEINSLEIVPTV